MGFVITPKLLREVSRLRVVKNLTNIASLFPGINPNRFKPALCTRLIVKNGILPNEKLTFGLLRRRFIGAKQLANMPYEKFKPDSMWNKRTMLQLNKAKSGAADWYKSNDWRRRAMKYGGLTSEEASATSKFLSDNVRRATISPRPLVEGKTKGVTINDSIYLTTPESKMVHTLPLLNIIAVNKEGYLDGVTMNHEAHHAAMLSKGLLDAKTLGVTDLNVINGMAKLRANAERLAKIMDQNLSAAGLDYKKKHPAGYAYYNTPIELRSRVASLASLGIRKLKYYKIGDKFKLAHIAGSGYVSSL